MKNKTEIRELLEQFPQYKGMLFCKGFLITDAEINEDVFSFNNSWEKHNIDSFFLYHDSAIPVYTYSDGEKTYFMIGHAYNPITMACDENEILKSITADENLIWEKEAELTGVYTMGYIQGNTMCHWGDCAGMSPSFYGIIDGNYYVASHSMIVADLLDLKEDPYIAELKNYKFFHYFGNIMPGDLSPFIELKRTVPNHCYTFECGKVSCERFFPIKKIEKCESEEEYMEVCNKIAKMLRNIVTLILEKWPGRAALSLTGGKDSGTTLASAKNHYGEFKIFSYSSKPEESVDVSAAKKICEGLNLEHAFYPIPDENSPESGAMAEIIAYNMGNTAYVRDNESRKRMTLCGIKDYDVEIKSWISELGRAYQYKRYNKTHFPYKPTPRQCTTIYKVFVNNRKLVRKTDKVFENYISRFINDADLELFPEWTTMWGWEFEDSANGGVHLLGEHMLSHVITVPYNNRHMIELFLKTDVLKRARDEVHDDIIKINNPDLYDLNINIVNAAHTSFRAFMEQMYYEIHSRLPF